MSLRVGVRTYASRVADLRAHDPDAVADAEAQHAAVQAILRRAGLPPHRDPEDPSPARDWVAPADIGYGDLTALRVLAAHLAFEQPPPSADADAVLDARTALDDPVLGAYYADVAAPPRRVPPERRFDHLIYHSDAEGVYVPVAFAEVLAVEPEVRDAGGPVGSAHALLAECDRLARALGLPEGFSAAWAHVHRPPPWRVRVAAVRRGLAARLRGAGSDASVRVMRQPLDAGTPHPHQSAARACVLLREAARRAVAFGAVVWLG